MLAFVDMDGVLCDSIAEMFRRFGQGKTPKICKGSYDTSTILGIQDPWSQFGADFFESVGWTEDGRRILETVEQASGKDNVYICTSPTYESTSADGKLRWIRKHIPEYERRYVLTPNKWLLSRPGRVLIDDCDEQIEGWGIDGGIGILVPRPWNSKHLQSGIDVPAYIRNELEFVS